MKDKVRDYIKYFGVLILVISWGGCAIGTSESMPKTAVVYVDDQARTYISPPCVGLTAGLREVRVSEAYRLEYKPDHGCREDSGFVGNDSTLTANLLRKTGILPELESRWNPDGSWNW